MADIFERKIKRIGSDTDGKTKRIPILRPKTTVDGTYFFLETFGKTGESYRFGKTADVVIYSNASVGRLFHNGIACESIDNKLIRFPSSEVFGTQIPRSCSDCTRRFIGKEEKAEYIKTHNAQPTVCQRGIRYYVGVIAKNRVIPAYIDMTFLRAKTTREYLLL